MVKPLNDFISEIKKDGLARQNRFSVLITQPKGMLTRGYSLELIQLFCEQAVLPGITYASQPIKTFGEDREVVYDRNFDDITLTFLVDRNMKVKSFFDDWSNVIINQSTRLMGFYENYTTTLIVYVQDVDDKDVYASILYEVYPKNISQIQLDNNSKDVMKLSVTFAYKYHENEQFLNEGGEQTWRKPFTPEQYTEQPPSKQSLSNYLKGSIGLPSNIPESYFTNFSEYQQVVNDGFSARNAVSMLERSGLTSGIGGIFI